MNKQARYSLFLVAAAYAFFPAGATEYNYVRTLVPGSALPATTSTEAVAELPSTIETVEFADGLGRTTLSLNKAQGPNREDIATLVQYDRAGLDSCNWIAVPFSNNNGAYIDEEQFRSAAMNFYGPGNYPFVRTSYENYATKRPVSRTIPGTAQMLNHPSRTVYSTNTASGEYSCRKFKISRDTYLQTDGYYPPASLHITKTTDGDGRVSIKFEDLAGHTVLIRNHTGDISQPYADTYSVYDEYGDLRYHISPEASAQLQDNANVPTAIVNSLCYSYKYDIRHRLTHRTIPGCGAEYLVYNDLNQLVASQTATQRARREWTVIQYDANHRKVLVGTVKLTKTQAQMQTLLSDVSATQCVFDTNAQDSDLMYTSAVEGFQPLMAWYYGDYRFAGDVVPATLSGFNLDTSIDVRGLPTGTAMKCGERIIKTAVYYDRYDREICHNEWDAELQDYKYTDYISYDFRGNTTHRHAALTVYSDSIGAGTWTADWRYTLDHADRVKKIEFSPDQSNWITLADYTFDNLGRTIHNNVPVPVDYTYNSRNQLTGIDAGNALRQTLFYENPPQGATPSYSANVSAYSDTTSLFKEMFSLSYDGLNRLTGFTNAAANMAENYTFDLNANPLNIERKYRNATVQNAALTYNGNQIASISDISSNSYSGQIAQFVRGDYSDPYTYDKDGRITSDKTRFIASIEYWPYTPQPRLISFNNGTCISFDYRPDGKLTHQCYTTHTTGAVVPGIPARAAIRDTTVNVVDSALYTTVVSHYYAWNCFEKKGTTMRVRTGAGSYDYDGGTHYWALKDWKGSTRSVVSLRADGSSSRSGNAFIYPSGLMASALPGAHIDRKHQDKRWIAENGLNLYDNLERLYDPILGRFITPDRLASKYPQFSPYTMAAANPATYFDQQGDSVAVLRDDIHIAMLIQNRNGEWEYFSVNGDKIYEYTSSISEKIAMGRGYNCAGVNHGWKSVEAFIADTEYNSYGLSGKDDSVSGMNYTDYVILPTTAAQDDLIRESMRKSCGSTYNLGSRNCATAVYNALKAGGALPEELEMKENKFRVSSYINNWRKENFPPYLFELLKSQDKQDNK